MNKLPDIKKPEGRKELGQYLCRCIEAGGRQVGNMNDRWSRLEAMAKQVPTDEGSNYDETNVPRTFPLMSPKLDQLVGAICGPVLSSSPYFTAKGYGASKPKARKGQEVVQFLLERNGFDRWFRRAVRRACTSEPAITFCYFSEEPDSFGPQVDVIHPKDFILYPAYKGGIKSARVCADRYYARLGDIKDDPTFYEEKTNLVGGDRPDDPTYGSPVRADEFEAALNDDQAVECWRVVAKIGDEYHLCRVAFKNQTLLSCEPYGVTVQGVQEQELIPFLRPGYFEVILQEAEENKFLRDVPVAHKMQALQLVFDKLLNCMIDGSEMAATPPIIATGAIGDAGKLIEYEPNSIIAMQGQVNLFPVPTSFRAGEMPPLLTIMSELADAASRVSQAGQGQQFSGSPTATEVAGVLQGQAMGLDEFRSNATQGPAEMCSFIVELAQLYFVKLLGHYADDFPVQSVEEFAGEYTFEPTGKTIESTPGALIEKTKLAMEMAKGMVEMGMAPPQMLMEFFKLLLNALNLPIEDHVIEQYFQPTGLGGNPGNVPLAGMGGGIPQDPEFVKGLLEGLGGAGPGQGTNPNGQGAGQVGTPPVPRF